MALIRFASRYHAGVRERRKTRTYRLSNRGYKAGDEVDTNIARVRLRITGARWIPWEELTDADAYLSIDGDLVELARRLLKRYGRVPDRLFAIDFEALVTPAPVWKRCAACNGKGKVQVPADAE